MRRAGILWIMAASLTWGDILPFEMRPDANATLPGMTILDQKHLVLDRVNALPFSEISDLAYRPKTHTLFMLSDKGRLFSFGATFTPTSMTLKPDTGSRIMRTDGNTLRKNRRDSEGLTTDNTGKLFASFEGKPRVVELDHNGRILHTLKLPRALRSLQHYRSRNKGLEALTWHPKYGLIVAKERPRSGSLVNQTLYSLSGKVWHFKAESIPTDSVTAIATMADGNVLVLERAFVKRTLLGVVTLKKVYLNEQKRGWCRTERLGQLRTDRGWLIDNFEGLVRIAPHRYVMVSDDNDNFFQKTLLVYFEVK